MNALIGRKLGMARLFNEEGTHVPVTVIEAGPCPIVQVTSGAAGTAVQLGFGAKKDRKSTRLNSSHSQISYAVFCLKKKNEYTLSSTSCLISGLFMPRSS